MSRIFVTLAAVLTTIVGVTPVAAAAADAAPRKTAANVMTEIVFTAAADYEDPFNEVTLDVVFTDPAGVARRVPAFWAGGKSWKVRYSSPAVGTHTFRTVSSDAADAGLHGVTGTVEVEPYEGDNPLYARGPLRVAEGGRYLEHADGTPFFWLGDTWWMGLTTRLKWPDEFKTLAADRKAKGFNVVQIVAGLYPDMPAFDERGANEAGFPWEKDYARIRPEYFDDADRKILYLAEQGFVPCVVGAWGYHLPWLGREKMQQHQRYVYARWGALPMVWCVAGELNLPYYLNPGFPQGGEKQTAGWEEVIRYTRSINAFGRLVTAHPTGIPPMSARGVLKDPSVLDFDMLQTPHGQMEALPPTVNTVRFSYGAEPPMPSVNAEPSYEMLHDKTPAEIARMIFWVSWANGVKGYTYGANGIWQLNGKDRPYGNSPWGGNYGKIAWQDAMHLGGSTQVALGKKLLSNYEWQRFEPKPACAAWAQTAPKDVPLGDWIWFPEGEPAADAPVAARFFRRTFEIPQGAEIKSAVLRIAADDKCAVWLNGQEVGSHDGWQAPREFAAVAGKLKPGRNVLAVRAENVASNVVKNPAGMIGGMVIGLAGGKQLAVATDAEWRTADAEAAGWHLPEFDDATWAKAKRAAPYGGPPWGNIGTAGGQDAYVVPYAMGIPGGVRVVYVPRPGAVVVKELEPGTGYAAFHFDPATGERKPLGEVKGDKEGSWRSEPPETDHDWVLVLEAKK